jgi:beta-lactam-binding protein with PASTA domain/predicted Ser/Thr protein kinase
VPDVSEGSVVDGRYRVLKRIGSGGMADVWLADDAHLQRRVALKVLHSRFSQDREFVERFRREAEAAAGLQHPNIVAVFDRGEFEGSYYIAMQYVEGRTLKQLIDAGLSPEQAVRLIRQVLEAARFAHRHGIVHRDLKPQNVIVDAEGKAVVTDFGIARAGVSEITQAGSVMGTPHYLSPEQAQGMDVTAVSDLYSIGVMLYEALTGRVPFEGESAVTVAMKQVSQMPQRPSSINPRISPSLDAVVMRALEKDPGQRFQSADAFIAALDAALEDSGQAGGGTAAFAPLPPVVATPAEKEAEEPDSDEERQKKRRRRWLLVGIAVLIGALVGFALTRDTTTSVPNVTGNQLGVAISLLQQDGFPVREVKRVERDTPQNTVLEQDPAASPPADKASLSCAFLSFSCSKPAVTLTVSAGPGSAKVPSTAGLTRAEAEAKLKRAGFGVQVKDVHSSSVAPGVVVYSTPSGGTAVTRGSDVVLALSSGPKLATVPVLVSTQRSVAVQQIRARGLVAAVTEETSSTPVGQVIRQSPSAGREVEPGSTVSIVVSKGQQKVSVPDVIGKLRSEAATALREAGLKPTVSEQETEASSKVGHVIDQLPTAGAKVEKGTEVTVVVGKAAEPTEPAEPGKP